MHRLATPALPSLGRPTCFAIALYNFAYMVVLTLAQSDKQASKRQTTIAAMDHQNHHQQQQRRLSTSSDANPSTFDVIQKIILDPLSACYAEDAYHMVAEENTREWNATPGMDSNRSLDSAYIYNPISNRLENEDFSSDEEEDDVTLNGLIDDAMSHKSHKTASTYTMAREHSSSSRSSSGEYGIPVLRELPSFGTHSFMSGIGGSNSSSPARHTSVSMSRSAVSEDSSLMSEYESKLPNINTIRKPVNPAMLP